jgi:hypothetical protein
MDDRYLLLGTDDGLSVLDLLPGLHGGFVGSDDGHRTGQLSLGDAKARQVWVGESVHQLRVLETAPPGVHGDVEKGVVLAIVGSDLGNAEGRKRSVRMYNLASLCELVKFVVNSPVRMSPCFIIKWLIFDLLSRSSL